MFSDLIGDLAEVRLYDLLTPLVDGKKTGLLTVKGVVTAEIYLEGGRIVHVRIDTRSGEEALPSLLDLDNGRVTFNWRRSAEEHTIHLPTERILSDWSDREEAWRVIRLRIPSTRTLFSLVVENDGQDRVIPGDYWGVLALCDGRHNVSEIAARLGRGLFEVSGILHALAEGGLIEIRDTVDPPGAESSPTVEETFFEVAETELKKVMGPIARIILNDTLDAFEETRQAFPKERVKSFISTVCDQIPEESKRERFGKAMYVAWLSSLDNR